MSKLSCFFGFHKYFKSTRKYVVKRDGGIFITDKECLRCTKCGKIN